VTEPLHDPGYGLIAEFTAPERLLEAVRRARLEGYRKLEAYSPFPVEGLVEAVGKEVNGIPFAMLIGAILAAGGLYLFETISSVWSYPFNIGGRPDFSWPAFVLPALEVTFLGAGLAGFIAMLILNRLPKYYHPVFNAPHFDRASRDRFFLCVEATDPQFDLERTRQLLEGLAAIRISEIER
jgi:hypothetical protein